MLLLMLMRHYEVDLRPREGNLTSDDDEEEEDEEEVNMEEVATVAAVVEAGVA